MKKMYTLLFCVILSAFFTHAYGQVNFTGTYTENFDTYAGNSGSLPAGWTVSTSVYLGVANGSGNQGGTYAYSNGSADRALGVLRSGSTNNITITASFRNTTGSTITALNIAYSFEQWRYAGNATGLTASSTLGNVSALSQAGAASGTNGIVQVSPKSVSLTGLNVANNATFTISWVTTDEGGADNGIAVDNFSMSLPVTATSITTTPASFGPFCSSSSPSASFNVAYTSTGSFTGSFKAQLSDAAGVFPANTTSNIIGTGTVSPISSAIPAGTAAGANYKIRIINDNPSTYGTNNGSDITVNAAVIPSVSIAASTATICSGTSVTFNATPVNPGTTPGYQWKVNGSNVGTNTATYTSTALANNDVVTCVLTSNAVCATPASVTSNAISMTVNSYVTPAVTISSATGNSICNGTAATFNAVPSNGGGTPTYQWKLNGGNAGTNSPTYITSTLADNDIVTCIMTSNAPCLLATTATSNAVAMNVDALITPVVSITESINSVCEGTPVTFTASFTNEGPTPVFQWKVNGASVGTNTYTYTDNTLSNDDIITVQMTSSAVCPSPAMVVSNSVKMDMSRPVTPAVSLSRTPAGTICDGMVTVYSATITYAGNNPTYRWEKNGMVVGGNDPYFGDRFLPGDQIKCYVVSNATCVTSANVEVGAIPNVQTSTPPVFKVSASPSNYIAAGESATFTADISNLDEEADVQWYLNDVKLGGSLNKLSYTLNYIKDNDVITCVVKTNSACHNYGSYSSEPIVMHIGTNVQQYGSHNDLKLYPNPNNGSFTIDGNTGFVGKAFLQMHDVTGKKVYQQNIDINNTIKANIELDKSLPAGTYFLRLYNEQNSQVSTFTVNKQ